jgi:PDZ domain-containing protein
MATLTSSSAARDTPGRVVRGPLAWTPPEPPNKNWWTLIGVPIVFLLVVAFLVSLIQLPYVELAPGGAEPINQLLKVPKQYEHPPKGSFLLTTVSLIADVHPFDMVRDYFDPNIVIIKRKAIFGDSSKTQYNQQAAQDMDDSKQNAVVLALRTLGYPVAEHGDGALVGAIANGEIPAKGQIAAGDVITAVDTTPAHLAQEAIGALQRHKPGDTVTLTVTKKDGTVTHPVIRLGSRTETSCTIAVVTAAVPCLGVTLGTKNHKFDYPFDVKIDTSNIGGPSAGLAFTLALIDELTPGELTGGHNVAVTGTIDIDGTVGDVGGVVQKTAAVRRSGAALFLVPPGEFTEASRHAGKHLKVVQVKTLADALAALRDNGGEAPVLPPAGK